MNLKSISSYSQLLQKKSRATWCQFICSGEKSKNAVANYEIPIPDQKEKLIEASKNMNDILKTLETTLRFQFHEKLEEYYVYRRKPDGPGY